MTNDMPIQTPATPHTRANLR